MTKHENAVMYYSHQLKSLRSQSLFAGSWHNLNRSHKPSSLTRGFMRSINRILVEAVSHLGITPILRNSSRSDTELLTVLLYQNLSTASVKANS